VTVYELGHQEGVPYLVMEYLEGVSLDAVIGSDEDRRGLTAMDASGSGTQPVQNQMSLSTKGLDFIKRHEGYRDKVYKDSAGYPTIGYGHLIKKGENFDKGITEQKAAELLSQDTKSVVDAVNAKVSSKLSQVKFDALVDFAFNLGAGNLGKSTLLKNINAGKDVTKENFTDWNRAGGKAVVGLTTRRTDEFNLFSKGDYGTP
jgi:lysozyme